MIWSKGKQYLIISLSACKCHLKFFCLTVHAICKRVEKSHGKGTVIFESVPCKLFLVFLERFWNSLLLSIKLRFSAEGFLLKFKNKDLSTMYILYHYNHWLTLWPYIAPGHKTFCWFLCFCSAFLQLLHQMNLEQLLLHLLPLSDIFYEHFICK